ncbi:ABC transporter permease [Mesorhizobium sp. M0115]|uniref:ABC transporter permease n=1 Tax=unclassified Mesorhizobium TaxID=325217 RepID=UPI00333D95A9
MLRFIAADLKRHWIGVAAVALLIALATALGVAVTLGERALRLGSARAAGAFDLVVGAPGSETQLLLSAVFLQAAPLTLMPGNVLAGLIRDERVAWAAPVGFGDFVEDFPIVGTTQALVDGLGGVSEGRTFEKLGEALVGASVAKNMGSRFHPAHGQVRQATAMHNDVTYAVVGRLRPTGTAWDRAVIVPIEAVWHIHERDRAGTGSPLLQAAAQGAAETSEFDQPIHPEAVLDPSTPGLPAIVVKPRTVTDAYKLRQAHRNDRTVAIFPGEVLTRLYGTLGDARRVLSLVAGGAQALVAAAILLVVVLHVMQRRRQIGALRAFGAPRAVVFEIVWLETFAIIAAGVLLGFGLGYTAARTGAHLLSGASGFTLPVEFRSEDWQSALVLLAVTGLIALVPAMLAYRQSPAQAFRN